MFRYKFIFKICFMLVLSLICNNYCHASRPMDSVWNAWETQTKCYVRISGNDSNNGQTPGLRGALCGTL